MKVTKFFAMLLMMVGAMVSFTACSSDDDESTTDSQGNPSIVGTWYYNTDEDDDWESKTVKEVVEITFNKNGTGSLKQTETKDGVSSNLSSTFSYVLTWDKGVGKLIISDVKGSYDDIEGNYTLNSSSSNVLTATSLTLKGTKFRKK